MVKPSPPAGSGSAAAATVGRRHPPGRAAIDQRDRLCRQFAAARRRAKLPCMRRAVDIELEAAAPCLDGAGGQQQPGLVLGAGRTALRRASAT